MSDPKYLFQYCQKIIVLDKNLFRVLLAKRKGEADYDGAYSFIGGKMEISDESIIEGLRREKNEEIGEDAKLKLYPKSSSNVLFQKADGATMILPHYLAFYIDGDINLNPDEYSEYRWIAIKNLADLKPVIENVPQMVEWAVDIAKNISDSDFIEI
jgi:8-oxo-dGTP pyrophosphatase MutT (NUDIX family)